MPSSVFSCVNASDVDSLGKIAASYLKISSVEVVVRCATIAGYTLQSSMRSLVYGEPSISTYRDVADGFHVWSDNDNVYVGLGEEDPLLTRALEMDRIYQVADVAFDLAKQSGEVEMEFHSELASELS